MFYDSNNNKNWCGTRNIIFTTTTILNTMIRNFSLSIGKRTSASIGSLFSVTKNAYSSSAVAMGLHDYSLNKIDGTSVDLSCYKGKPVLLLNVATL